ncbi:MAG: LamG domain-containing protein [Deltaproteobacteria bacterium]|nr:LamG domain-containing protein [Deltaproteobacteria bacterium]
MRHHGSGIFTAACLAALALGCGSLGGQTSIQASGGTGAGGANTGGSSELGGSSGGSGSRDASEPTGSGGSARGGATGAGLGGSFAGTGGTPVQSGTGGGTAASGGRTGGGGAADAGGTGSGGISASGGASGGGPGSGGRDAGADDGPGSDSATGGSATGGSATGGTDGAAGDTSVTCIGDDCCPDDPDKTQPGICGCGVSDTDTDEDGTPDCNDLCITDRNKTEPGVCGCNGSEADTDGDGTPDCEDLCPRDATRITLGACGCGLPDSAAPYCLAHRYSFNGSAGATAVTDSVGTAHGKTVNVTLPGTGILTLAGGTTDQYVELPSGIISGLGGSATVEAWIAWDGGGYWQRVFDFGTNENGETGGQGTGTEFLFFTPLGGAGGPFLSFNSGGLTEVAGTAPFPQGLASGGKPHHVACVIDAKGSNGSDASAMLFIDGALIQKTTPLQSSLSYLRDVNNWLGRAQFVADDEFSGTYYEFRIYSAALTQNQIAANVAAGPDSLP